MPFTFLNKLDFLMEEKKLNKNTLSKESGIPYTTIDGWYKKGYEGLKLTTLKKLSDFLNVDIGYWTDKNILKTTDYITKNSPTEQVALQGAKVVNLIDEKELEKFYKMLCSVGLVQEGEDLTLEQTKVLMAVKDILCVTFPNFSIDRFTERILDKQA